MGGEEFEEMILSANVEKMLIEVRFQVLFSRNNNNDQILPSDDPLDREEFDVVEFFNRNFPDENALNELQPFTDRISRSRDETESTIGQLLHDQSKIGPQSMMELQAAQEAIEFLFLKIQEIKSKAEKSEIMVQKKYCLVI